MRNIAVFFLYVTIAICFPVISAAQTINSDSLFAEAKKMAKANNYAAAQKICTDILGSGENGDVRFYLGLLYSWDGKYEKARTEFEKVHESRPKSEEVIVAMANNELWADNPQAALDIVNKALIDSPNNEEFLYLKARALNNLKQYDEAIAVLEQLLKINPNNDKAKQLLDSIKVSQMKNAIAASVGIDVIHNTNPWYLSSLQYSRKTNIGSVIGRLNYANRFGLNSWQVETDAYPGIGKHSYLYLNAGISDNQLFPKYRFGAEFFQGLPKSFEVSLGFRYLHFTSSDVNIYTGSIGKYYGNFWFSFREFVTPSGKGGSFTEIFQVRRYFSTSDDYVGVQYSHGSSPDDVQTFLLNAYNLKLPSDKIRLSYSHRFSLLWVGSASAAYEKEVYSFNVSLQRIF